MGAQNERLRGLRTELDQVRVELSGWREELLTVLADGQAQRDIDWRHVHDTAEHMVEMLDQFNRLLAAMHVILDGNGAPR